MRLLDDLIYTLYGKLGTGPNGRQMVYLDCHPERDAVGEWLMGRAERFSEDPEVAGREMTLLMAFHDLREEMRGWPVPQKDGFNGDLRRFFGSWAGTYPKNELSGEIPWRCFHNDPDWPCTECGHGPSLHSKDEEGWRYCDGEGGKCNCGNNIGR